MGRIAGLTTEETRRRLLDAAAVEFERSGFEGSRVADIAAGADLSNGALYGHFRSKSDLLSAALRERAAHDLELMFLGRDGQSIADLLIEIGRGLDRTRLERGGLMIESLAAARRDPEVAEVVGSHLADRQQWLADLIREGQEGGAIDAGIHPEALARFCITMVLGSALLGAAELGPTPGWTDLIARLAESMGADRAV